MYQILNRFISMNFSTEVLHAKGMALHDTDDAGATDENEQNYFNTGNRSASAHAFIDWDSISQLVRWDQTAWHAGYTANHSLIGVELCVPATHDVAKFNEVWKRGVWLFAYVMKEVLGISTVTKDNLMSHAEISAKWHETDHTDPITYFKEYGKTVDQFRAEVQNAINGGTYIPTDSCLKVGDTGAAVVELQRNLIKLKYNLGTSGADGIFGELTRLAIVKFEQDNRLSVDSGIAGPQVQAKIKELIAELDKPVVTVLYRVILDGVQREALSSLDSAKQEVIKAVDGGVAKTGKVQRNTDGADLFTYTKATPVVKVMYRVILDEEQKEALSVFEDAKAEVIKAVDSGIAKTGKVQRNTDNVDMFTYTKPVPTPTPEPTPTPVVITKHSLIGNSSLYVSQIKKYLEPYEKDMKINTSLDDLIYTFLAEGTKEGIRGDFALAQSILETNFFRFGGQVLPEQNNYAGIGAVNNSATGKGAWFKTPQEGIRAQMQHLKAYANTEALNNECVDPRFSLVARGIAPNLEDLAGRWAVPGYDEKLYKNLESAMENKASYGQTVYNIYEAISNIVPTPEPIKNKSIIDLIIEIIKMILSVFNKK